MNDREMKNKKNGRAPEVKNAPPHDDETARICSLCKKYIEQGAANKLEDGRILHAQDCTRAIAMKEFGLPCFVVEFDGDKGDCIRLVSKSDAHDIIKAEYPKREREQWDKLLNFHVLQITKGYLSIYITK